MSVAVDAIPNRSDFAEISQSRVVSELTQSSNVQDFVDLLDMHTVEIFEEVAHDQSSQVFDLMSLTDMSCLKSGGSEVDMSLDILVDGTADGFNGFIDSFSCDHESPVDHNFLDRPAILSKHQRKQSARAAKAQASASAGVADRILHTVHGFPNSSVGLGGSSLGNHQRYNNDDDVTNRNDVEICGEFGGGGSDVGISGKFGKLEAAESGTVGML